MLIDPEIGSWIGGVLAVRTLPFTIFVLLERRLDAAARIGWAMVYAVVLVAVGQSDKLRLFFYAGGLAYYASLALVVHNVQPFLLARSIPRSAIFAGLAVAYLIVPAALLPLWARPFLVFGCERLLAACSYCYESRQSTLRDCLFFLTVDPTVVYPERGRRVKENTAFFRGTSRIVVGAVTVGASVAILKAIGNGSGLSTMQTLLYVTLQFLSVYCAHSGVAAVQIGCMRLVGYRVGERYVFPLLASDPADFWRRWNTYWGSWFRRYVFFPVANRVSRKYRRVGFAKAVALMATFASVGALHDLSLGLEGAGLRVHGTAAFLGAGLTVLLWTGAKLAFRRLRVHGPRSVAHVTALAGGLVSRTCLWAFLVGTLWVLR
jgi:hypothetical protein